MNLRIRILCALSAALVIGTTAHAQSYSAAPMVVYGEGSAQATSADDSVRELGQATMGETITKPAAAPAAPQAAAPEAVPGTTAPASPPSPVTPANPVDKLWPRNTIQLFLPSCTGLKPQFLPPCTCVITKLMIVMPHDEFLKKSEDGTLEQDPRLISIRNQCIADALPKKE